MGKKSIPKAPDLSSYADALSQSGEWGFLTSQEQLKWAKEQDALNRQLLDRVLAVQLPAMEEQQANARKDRARYEDVYQPIENNLVQDFQTFDSPERRAQERGRAASDMTQTFDAARRNALQRLEGYGIDPSQTRNAALDLGTRVQQAAATAGAMTNATRNVEDKSRALRADAINIGRGMPSQVAQSYGQAVAAGQAGIGGANMTTGTSSSALQGANSFAQTGQAGYLGAGNMATQGFNNSMSAWNAGQQSSAGAMQGIGSLIGMAGMFMADGGQPGDMDEGPEYEDDGYGMLDEGPSDGSGIDDQVVARVSVGEYVIPADVVQIKGREFFDKLIEKYHTPADEQRESPSWRHQQGGGYA